MAKSKRHMNVPKERVLERVVCRATTSMSEHNQEEPKSCQAKP
ncbi:hypothetical protein MARSALSMR5_00321 [Marinobacter salarius]|uniref:Uncharacterized protein n=1 Tax=Marinobacter salarius TaxID=1420917 RepID=A0A1W6K4X7_9GAMM|nr:hypothetical protein MARSALSMR5_00321 [Marinobacter salarius]